MKKEKRNQKKGAMLPEEIGKWAIAIGVLILVIVFFLYLSSTQGGIVNFFKNIIRFGGTK